MGAAAAAIALMQKNGRGLFLVLFNMHYQRISDSQFLGRIFSLVVDFLIYKVGIRFIFYDVSCSVKFYRGCVLVT